MTILPDREQAFEREFVLRQEAEFRKWAHRNKSLGRWAADQLGLTGATADAYVSHVIELGVEARDDDVLVTRLVADLQARGVEQTERDVRAAIASFAELSPEELGRRP